MKELICIVCPNGCRLEAEEQNGKITVTGNQCSRGIGFAEAEMTHPTRTLTTTVKTTFPGIPVLPVRTAGEVPKPQIPRIMQALREVTVSTPLGIGETVCENILGLGVKVIATSNIIKEQE
jgi:CxxC motif-containing protein